MVSSIVPLTAHRLPHPFEFLKQAEKAWSKDFSGATHTPIRSFPFYWKPSFTPPSPAAFRHRFCWASELCHSCFQNECWAHQLCQANPCSDPGVRTGSLPTSPVTPTLQPFLPVPHDRSSDSFRELFPLHNSFGKHMCNQHLKGELFIKQFLWGLRTQ